MKMGEVGCLLSHFQIWNRIVSDKIPLTLILEDDASPPDLFSEQDSLRFASDIDQVVEEFLNLNGDFL